MGKQRMKPNYRRRVLRLPDLDHCKLAVLNSLGSPASRRVYEYAIDQFIAWYCSEPRLAFSLPRGTSPLGRRIIRRRIPACKPFYKTSATLSGSCAMLLRLR